MTFSRLAALLILSACFFPKIIWPAPDPRTIEAAKKERTVAYYTGLNVNAVQRLAGAFEQRYPFLKVEPARQGHVQLRTRILTESLAGAHRVDVVSMPAIDLQLLKKKGAAGIVPVCGAGRHSEGPERRRRVLGGHVRHAIHHRLQ